MVLSIYYNYLYLIQKTYPDKSNLIRIFVATNEYDENKSIH